MKVIPVLVVSVVLAACVDQGDPPGAWTEVNVSREIFGSGRDGDVTVPAAGVLTLTQDLYAHDLIFPRGVISDIDPNGFAIYVSGTLRTGGLVKSFSHFVPSARIRRSGMAAVDAATWGVGYPATGTIGQGGSGTGGFSAAISLQTAGSLIAGTVWMPDAHPSPGGFGGGAGGVVADLPATAATIALASRGSWSIDNAIRMRTSDGAPIAGGAPGAGGAGQGGSGGAGGGNIVIVANEIEAPEGLLLESEGGAGGSAIFANGGGGGGGSGGIITLATYRKQPLVNVSVVGGPGGFHLGTANDGGAGGQGQLIPYYIAL